MSDPVRQFDKDRYLATLFAPAEKQPALLALYAFNLEIVRIRSLVSEPQIGEIRLQWWRDTVAALYRGEASAHPVAQELALAIAQGNLPQAPLQNLITAHEWDLYDDPMPDLATLEGYLGETSSALIQMASLILGAQNPQAAGLAGVAYGLARMLHDPRLPDIDLKSHVRNRLAEARAQKIPKAALPAFLPASLTELYLKQKEPSQFRRQSLLWLAARRERI